jgi:hypothetical protein
LERSIFARSAALHEDGDPARSGSVAEDICCGPSSRAEVGQQRFVAKSVFGAHDDPA